MTGTAGDATSMPVSSHPLFRRAASPLAAFGLGRRYAHRRGRAWEVLESFPEHLVGRILDVGAGANGPVFREQLGDRYHALDLSSSYKQVSEADRSAVNLHVDLEGGRLPFADREFDTVMCMDVVEHVDDAHRLYRELFRVAGRRLLVSLPNNWPHFLWSLLAGRNVTHRGGYGLAALPKPPGQRHKHFFNLEEATDFLVGAAPPGFECVELAFRCEHGSDGLLSTMPGLTRLYRVGGKVTIDDARSRVGSLAVPAWVATKLAWAPLRALDLVATGAVYGLGSRVRYLNFGCRQVWAVFAARDDG